MGSSSTASSVCILLWVRVLWGCFQTRSPPVFRFPYPAQLTSSCLRICYFPLLVLNGTYHYRICFFSRGLSQMEATHALCSLPRANHGTAMWHFGVAASPSHGRAGVLVKLKQTGHGDLAFGLVGRRGKLRLDQGDKPSCPCVVYFFLFRVD